MADRRRYSIGPRRSIGENHWKYDVTIDGVRIHTTVTRNKRAVANWIRRTYNYHEERNNGGVLIVGFDAKRRRYCPYCIIQLLVGQRCLIYQIYLVGPYAIPRVLEDFFGDPIIRFVGVKASEKMRELRRDYHIEGRGECWDLGARAARIYDQEELRDADLGRLALRVVWINFNSVQWRRVSNRWDAYHLTRTQVLYATFHAYLSFEIGETLYEDEDM